MIGETDVKLIEGLVIDARDAGVGFRSHTVPNAVDVPDGAEWEEDLLFSVPETSCVDTNVTTDYVVPFENDYSANPTQYVVDQGGFSAISRHNLWDGWTYGSTQQNPKLADRAYLGAWKMNILNMFYFGVSEPGTELATIDSHIGKTFAVTNSLGQMIGQAPGLMSLATLSL